MLLKELRALGQKPAEEDPPRGPKHANMSTCETMFAFEPFGSRWAGLLQDRARDLQEGPRRAPRQPHRPTNKSAVETYNFRIEDFQDGYERRPAKNMRTPTKAATGPGKA
eukprot:2541-Pyramimonas_sp.AAC.1